MQISQMASPAVFNDDGRKLFVLPVSATEQHGSHLPMGTDSVILDEIAQAVAQTPSLQSLIWLPHLAYGCSIEHMGCGGALTLQPETLMSVVTDIASSLKDVGEARLAILNGHGGNAALLTVLARVCRARYGIPTTLVRPLASLPTTHEGKVDMRAGYYETCLMLHLAPGLVSLESFHANEQRSGGGVAHPSTVGWMVQDFAGNGVIGDPTMATSAHGKELFESLVERTVLDLESVLALEVTNRD